MRTHAIPRHLGNVPEASEWTNWRTSQSQTTSTRDWCDTWEIKWRPGSGCTAGQRWCTSPTPTWWQTQLKQTGGLKAGGGRQHVGQATTQSLICGERDKRDKVNKETGLQRMKQADDMWWWWNLGFSSLWICQGLQSNGADQIKKKKGIR